MYCYALLLLSLPLTMTSDPNVILNKIGDISFFEKTWTLTNDINLRNYVENAIVLQNATDKIIKICNNIPNDINCKYFEENVQRNAIMAKKEIDQIVLHRRRKNRSLAGLGREILKQALIAAGITTVTGLIAANEIDKLREQQLRDRKALVELMEINQIRNNLSFILNDRIQELEKSKQIKDDLNDLINIAKQALDEHNQQTKIYVKIFNNDFKKILFKIIEMEHFQSTIKEIDLLLHPYARLPTINPYQLLEISSISYSNNNTHISIHTKIPILTTNSNSTLYEFVPIPMNKDSTVQILNSYAKVFFTDSNNTTKVMLPLLLNHCKQISDHIICDSVLHETLTEMDQCMSSIVLGGQISSQCKFMRIDKRNYFIQLSNHKIFCFIISPIQFRITCNEQEKIYSLKENIIVDFSDQCDVHKVLNEIQYDTKTSTTMEIDQIRAKPNFSVFNRITNNWTDSIDIYTQYDFTVIRLTNKTNDLSNTLKPESDNIWSRFMKIPEYIWTTISNTISFFTSKLFATIFVYIIIPVLVSMCIYFLCIHYIKK